MLSGAQTSPGGQTHLTLCETQAVSSRPYSSLPCLHPGQGGLTAEHGPLICWGEGSSHSGVGCGEWDGVAWGGKARQGPGTRNGRVERRPHIS